MMSGGFSPKTLERSKLEQNGERHRVPLVKTLQNMYVLPPKGQGQMLTSGHVTLRSTLAKVGQNAYHSMRLDKTNTMRPRARLYLFSMRSFWQKTTCGSRS